MRSWHLGLVAAAMLGLTACGAGQKVWAATTPTEPGAVDRGCTQGIQHDPIGLEISRPAQKQAQQAGQERHRNGHVQGLAERRPRVRQFVQDGQADHVSLDQVIKGWGEGVQLIGEGGMIELEIPPELVMADRECLAPSAASHAALHR